jgi:hypothetical protein
LQSPIKAAENKCPAALIQQVLTSPFKHNHQTILQTNTNPTSPVNVIEFLNLPQLPREVTPAAKSALPPMVQARARNLSPRNLSHDDFLDMGSANQAISLGNTLWTNMFMVNAGIHPITEKEMHYMDLINDQKLQPLWKIGFGKELGRLFQRIRDI